MSALQWVDLAERFDADLLEQAYRTLYLPAFPVSEEREDPAIWTPRLQDPAAHPRLSFVVAGTGLDDPAQRTIQGLLVTEYYAESRCLLLSYIAVAPDMRGQGVARWLLDIQAARIASGAVSGGQPVAAVYAEIHDPERIDAQDDVLDPHVRVDIMARLGARRLPVEYVQPALGPGRQPSHDLWLLVFPELAAARPASAVETLRAFLIEFYRALGSPAPDDDPAYAAVFASIDRLAARAAAGLPVHEALELRVRSCLRVRQAAVAFRYLASGPIDDDVANCPPEQMVCRNFHSYEKDLLSHAFRCPTPMRTYCLPTLLANGAQQTYALPCTLVFPDRLRFESEGETITLRREGCTASRRRCPSAAAIFRAPSAA